MGNYNEYHFNKNISKDKTRANVQNSFLYFIKTFLGHHLLKKSLWSQEGQIFMVKTRRQGKDRKEFHKKK